MHSIKAKRGKPEACSHVFLFTFILAQPSVELGVVAKFILIGSMNAVPNSKSCFSVHLLRRQLCQTQNEEKAPFNIALQRGFFLIEETENSAKLIETAKETI